MSSQSVISIHVPREGHDPVHCFNSLNQTISIHVPREGHDDASQTQSNDSADISIHVPREGHDDSSVSNCEARRIFQSTCPARGTTSGRLWCADRKSISIHVPREGHDAP